MAGMDFFKEHVQWKKIKTTKKQKTYLPKISREHGQWHHVTGLSKS